MGLLPYEPRCSVFNRRLEPMVPPWKHGPPWKLHLINIKTPLCKSSNFIHLLVCNSIWGRYCPLLCWYHQHLQLQFPKTLLLEGQLQPLLETQKSAKVYTGRLSIMQSPIFWEVFKLMVNFSSVVTPTWLGWQLNYSAFSIQSQIMVTFPLIHQEHFWRPITIWWGCCLPIMVTCGWLEMEVLVHR